MPGRGRAPSYWRRVKSLLLNGHLPDLRAAALRLATLDSDYDAVMALADGYPTSRLAVREGPAPGRDRMAPTRTFVVFMVPRFSSGDR